MDQNFEAELRKTYFQEADIILEDAEGIYLKFNSDTPIEILEHSFRLAHNLKGSSKAVGFSNIAEILHHIESLLIKLKEKRLKINNKITNILLSSNDTLKHIIDNLKDDPKFYFDSKKLIEEID